MTMDWKRLLSSKQVTEPSGEPDKGRSKFERDHDRTVFNSAFSAPSGQNTGPPHSRLPITSADD